MMFEVSLSVRFHVCAVACRAFSEWFDLYLVDPLIRISTGIFEHSVVRQLPTTMHAVVWWRLLLNDREM